MLHFTFLDIFKSDFQVCFMIELTDTPFFNLTFRLMILYIHQTERLILKTFLVICHLKPTPELHWKWGVI